MTSVGCTLESADKAFGAVASSPQIAAAATLKDKIVELKVSIITLQHELATAEKELANAVKELRSLFDDAVETLMVKEEPKKCSTVVHGPDGDKHYDGQGRLHRDNGPAVVMKSGYKEWWVHGVCTRAEPIVPHLI